MSQADGLATDDERSRSSCSGSSTIGAAAVRKKAATSDIVLAGRGKGHVSARHCTVTHDEAFSGRAPSARATGDELLICHQLLGSMALQQCGRDVFFGSREFVVIDPMLPYIAKLPSSSRMLLLKVPRQALEARVGRTANSSHSLSNLQIRRIA
jgi:hypothetical protein